MNIWIDSDDEEFSNSYHNVIEDMLMEFRLTLLSSIWIYARLKDGYFIISAEFKTSTTRIHISDCALIEQSPEGTRISVDPSKEEYLPEILNILKIIISCQYKYINFRYHG